MFEVEVCLCSELQPKCYTGNVSGLLKVYRKSRIRGNLSKIIQNACSVHSSRFINFISKQILKLLSVVSVFIQSVIKVHIIHVSYILGSSSMNYLHLPVYYILLKYSFYHLNSCNHSFQFLFTFTIQFFLSRLKSTNIFMFLSSK